MVRSKPWGAATGAGALPPSRDALALRLGAQRPRADLLKLRTGLRWGPTADKSIATACSGAARGRVRRAAVLHDRPQCSLHRL